MMFTRVVYPIFGNAYWQKAYKDYQQDDAINHEWVEQNKNTVQAILISTIPIGILLDVVCYRYRHLSRWLIYYELVVIFLQGFVPFNFGDFKGLIILMLMI